MRSFCHNILASALLLCACASAFAQGGSVRLKLEDVRSGDPVGFATVSLHRFVASTDSPADGQTMTTAANSVVSNAQSTNSDTRGGSGDILSEANDDNQPGGMSGYKPYKFVTSNEDGAAEIKDVKSGTYVLRVDLVGYKSIERSVEVAAGEVNLGVLKMSADVEMLRSASVTAKGNPVLVKGDTVEFLTAPYATMECDVLEDLLKKLPGVEVRSDGSVTVNGEPVVRIMINGKPFFLDDPKIATKNLPAKLFDKVKVVEKKSDQAIFTGIDDGYRETVIDLSVKPGEMDNWSGTVTGAVGHDIPAGKNEKNNQFGSGNTRYKGSAMVKRFTDSDQLSFILNGNNMNNGTRITWTGGINGSFTLRDGNMDLSSPYSYKGSSRHTESRSTKTTYLDDGSTLRNVNEGTSGSVVHKHTIGMKLEHKFSKKTSLKFEPKFTYGSGHTNSYSNFTTTTNPVEGKSYWTNEGFRDNKGWNQNWSARGSLLFRQRLGKPGRTISASVAYSFSGSYSKGDKQSETFSLDEDAADAAEEVRDTSIINQRYKTTNNTHSIYSRVVFTEKLMSKLFLEVNASYSWSYRSSEKNVFDSSTNIFTEDSGGNRHLLYNRNGETLNKDYSYKVVTKNNTCAIGANLRYSRDSLKAQLGVVFRPYFVNEEADGEIYRSSYWKCYPQASLTYDFNENSNLRFTYSGGFSQVSLSRLAPVTSNSDPLNVSYGNPYLEPYFTHRFTGKFGYSNKKTFTTIQIRWRGNLVQNRITRATWYGSNGAQYSMPLNEPLSGNTNLRIQLDSPFAHSDFSVSSTTLFSYSDTKSYIGKTDGNEGDVLVSRYYDSSTGVWDYRQFHDDFFGPGATEKLHDYFNDLRTNTLTFSERLRFKYKIKNFEAHLAGYTQLLQSWYSVASYGDTQHWSSYVGGTVNWGIPRCKSLWVSATFQYHWYNGYSNRPSDRYVLNMSLQKRLVKNKLTLAIRAYDILNQTARTHVVDGSNFHRVTWTNTFGRYILLFLTYKFGEDPTKKK